MIRPAALALITAFVAQAALAPQPVHAQPARSSDASSSLSPNKLSRTDTNALKDMAQANINEVAAGKVALQNAQSPQVKRFAQMMIDDHTTGLKEVQQVAETKGVKLPDGPDVIHKTESKAMSSLHGAEFDRQYMKKAGVSDHRKVHDQLEKISKNAKDSDVKNLAEKMLPVVDGHLQHAQSMSRDGGSAKP